MVLIKVEIVFTKKEKVMKILSIIVLICAFSVSQSAFAGGIFGDLFGDPKSYCVTWKGEDGKKQKKTIRASNAVSAEIKARKIVSFSELSSVKVNSGKCGK